MKKKILVVAVGLALMTPAAFASVPWVGTADYLNAPGATGDEVKVGPFDTYDFGSGIGLIKNNTSGGFDGYFQTMVDGHFLSSVGINVPQLNVSGAGGSFTGTGNGFELTLVSHFTGVYTSSTASAVDFSITGGDAQLYFDTNPNYNFAADSGFTDGDVILSGHIAGGLGSIIFPGVIGIGVEQVALNFSGLFGSYNTNVYDPDTIVGGSTLFSIKTKALFSGATPVINSVVNGTNKVMGISAGGGQLAELDGTLQLTAVPVPAAAWLFGTGLMGFLYNGKRKKMMIA